MKITDHHAKYFACAHKKVSFGQPRKGNIPEDSEGVSRVFAYVNKKYEY